MKAIIYGTMNAKMDLWEWPPTTQQVGKHGLEAGL